MKHLKLIKQCKKLQKEYKKKIEAIRETVAVIKKNSRITVRLKASESTALYKPGLEFSMWTDKPDTVYIQSKNFNDFYGIYLTRSSARKLRNWLNIFLGDVK